MNIISRCSGKLWIKEVLGLQGNHKKLPGFGLKQKKNQMRKVQLRKKTGRAATSGGDCATG